METTTNTRKYHGLTDNACIAMALMQHLGNDYFIIKGAIVYPGTEEDARENYKKDNDKGNCDFERWVWEYTDGVDTEYDNITDLGYEVLTAQELKEAEYLGQAEGYKMLVLADLKTINDTLYLIFQRQN